MDKGRGKMGRALRRGVALGLALTALWGVGLTAHLGGLEEELTRLGERPGLAVSLMRGQLGALPGEEALTGWGRLLVDSAPLLSAGEEGVMALRLARAAEEGADDPVESIDGDDREQPDLEPAPGGERVLEMTGQGSKEGKYLYEGEVYVYDRTGLGLDSSVLGEGSVQVTMGEGPQILILHTHGSEAYSQADGQTYEESDPYRTTDCSHNVVKVGEEMATVFRAHGFQVLHDTTLYDYPAYNGAYERSQAAAERWLAEYPTLRVLRAGPRAAGGRRVGEIYTMVAPAGGAPVALVLVGGGTDAGGGAHPGWRDNLAFARLLQGNLVRGYRSLARPIVLRSSTYNQQLSPGYLLVEVGGHGNTLTEAVAGARLWADNVARTLLEL